MGEVMLALIPGTMVVSYFLGPGVLINLTLSVLVAIACEAAVLRLRKRDIFSTISDGSIVLAAWLLALCLPPSLPISQLVFGAITLTILGKHVYGGLGQNPFNPAMVAYAVLLISFPKSMTLWFDTDAALSLSAYGPDSWSAWWQLKWRVGFPGAPWDSITQATPLDQLRTLNHQNLVVNAIQSAELDTSSLSTTPWFEISFAWLLGGLYLLARGIIRWHIPIAMLIAAALFHVVLSYFFSEPSPPTWSALLYGGVIFGAFFIATDPVTAPSSTRARLCYGAGIGVLTMALRSSSNYPEGVAFAVLLMNAATPLFDRMFTLEARS